jgi:hypothetical protein
MPQIRRTDAVLELWAQQFVAVRFNSGCCRWCSREGQSRTYPTSGRTGATCFAKSMACRAAGQWSCGRGEVWGQLWMLSSSTPLASKLAASLQRGARRCSRTGSSARDRSHFLCRLGVGVRNSVKACLMLSRSSVIVGMSSAYSSCGKDVSLERCTRVTALGDSTLLKDSRPKGSCLDGII